MVELRAPAGGLVAGVTDTTTHLSSHLLRPGEALSLLLASEQPRSPATEWRAARTLRRIGVPCIKIAGHWRVPRAALEAWVANPAAAAAASAAQQARRRGAGRPSKADAALRKAGRALAEGGAA